MIPHPLHAGPRRLFVTATGPAANHPRQLIPNVGGQAFVGEVLERGFARPKWDIEPPDTLTHHAQKIGSAGARVESARRKKSPEVGLSSGLL